MSENFLSFVTNVAPKAAKTGSDLSGNPEPNSPQGVEFASIFKKEQVKANGLGGAVEQLDGEVPAFAKVAEDVQERNPSETATTTEAPVGLPVLPTSGNALPELSIHSRGLQVGRVILTTAHPKVSEESLNQFAQSQASEGVTLMAEQSMSPDTKAPQTRGILEGLMGQQQTAASQQPIAPVQALPAQHQPGVTIEKAQQAMTTPLPAGGQRQAFGDWRQYTQPASALGSQDPSKGVEASVSDALAAKDALAANMPKSAVTKAAGQTPDASVRLPLVTGEANPERALDSAPVAGSSDTAMQAQQTSSAGMASAGISNPQGALAHSPATALAGGLVEALTSTDNSQMQSRLQPYQAWAQRFGEVLAQKLSLAVKDGNWSVRLNLNPASLGPVGVELQVNNGGIEGQIAANDANVRQLLNDSLPRLRQSLEALVSDNAGVNIELSDHRENGAKQQREPDIEIPVDLLAEEFIPLKEAIADGNILRDGLNVFV